MKKLSELMIYNEDIPTKPGEIGLSNDYLIKPEISPYLIYIILREKFGPPNSDMIDEDKQQWEWAFRYSDFYITIYDWKLLSTSIAVYHEGADKEKSKTLAESINALLTKEALQRKSKIKSVIKSATRKIFENPFITYYSTAVSLLELASFIDDVILQGASAARNNSEVDISSLMTGGFELWEKKNDLYRSAFLMFLSSFEGFMNILYELYLKEELRTDRLYERINREQIDIKLRIAPIYCDGFKTKVINHEDDRFKNYLRLINLRNDYVHANLVKRLERYIHEEDDYTFIIENEDTSDIPTNISELELKHIHIAKECIDKIVELVIESMDTRTRKEFRNIIFQGEIEVEDEHGILIPKH